MNKTLAAVMAGAILGAGGTVAFEIAAAPGDALIDTIVSQRTATAPEAAAADTLATAIFGDTSLGDVVVLKHLDNGTWLVEGRGYVAVAVNQLPNNAQYRVVGRIGANGRPNKFPEPRGGGN